MDFKQIEAFVYVVRYKSFSKAADAIFLTQPTISTHINSLEGEIGAKLIDRSGKQVTPTKAGEIFYEYASNMINIRDNAIHTLNNYSSAMKGKIQISASTVPSQYILPQLMMAFMENYKNVSFSITQQDSNEVIEDLLDKKTELGIVGTRTESAKLIFHHLMDDDLVVIVPNNKKYAAIKGDSIPFQLIENEKFIFRESGSGTRQEFEHILGNKDHNKSTITTKSLDIVAQMNSIEAIKHAVSIGMGVSIASMLSVKDYVGFGLLKAFKVEGLDTKRSFYAVQYKNRPMSPLNSVFLEFILDYYKNK